MIVDDDNYLPIHLASLGRIIGKTGTVNEALEVIEILLEKGNKRGIYRREYIDNKGITNEEKMKNALNRNLDSKYEV